MQHLKEVESFLKLLYLIVLLLWNGFAVQF